MFERMEPLHDCLLSFPHAKRQRFSHEDWPAISLQRDAVRRSARPPAPPSKCVRHRACAAECRSYVTVGKADMIAQLIERQERRMNIDCFRKRGDESVRQQMHPSQQQNQVRLFAPHHFQQRGIVLLARVRFAIPRHGNRTNTGIARAFECIRVRLVAEQHRDVERKFSRFYAIHDGLKVRSASRRQHDGAILLALPLRLIESFGDLSAGVPLIIRYEFFVTHGGNERLRVSLLRERCECRDEQMRSNRRSAKFPCNAERTENPNAGLRT